MACGSSQPAGSTATSTTVTTALITKVVGTTPAGTVVTLTRALLTTPTDAPDGVTLQSGTQLAAATTTTVTVAPETVTSGTVTSATVTTQTNPLLTGQTVDGILCARLDQLAYQAYAYLRIYVDGVGVSVPGGIGLVSPTPEPDGTVTTFGQSTCAYWIHTHAANGVIEVRSPIQRTFTLGDFFDIWGQPLGAAQVGPARGRVTAIVNGQRWHGNPRSIPLHEHDSIELAVGGPVPRFRPLSWANTAL